MHPPERVQQALELARRGLNACEISRQTGIPRSTLREWIANGAPRGRTPRFGPTCDVCRAAEHDFTALPLDYAYLLGLYLGDGTISAHPRDVFRLRLFLDKKYPQVIQEGAEAMASIMPNNPPGRWLTKKNYVEVYSYSKSWPCLIPQHGPGMKHQRPIFLSDWQRACVARAPDLLLRGLIHSDGCRFMNTGRNGWRQPRYSFSQVSDDIKRIFCDACDLLGLRWTVAPNTVYVSRKADVALLDQLIGPKS